MGGWEEENVTRVRRKKESTEDPQMTQITKLVKKQNNIKYVQGHREKCSHNE